MTECDQQVSPFCRIWRELLIIKCILFHSFVHSATSSKSRRKYGLPSERIRGQQNGRKHTAILAISSEDSMIVATANRCHEEEVSRRAWWDRSLLSGGLETVPQLAGQQQRRWLQRGFSGQCLKTQHRLSCSATTSRRVTPVVPSVGSARICRRG